MSVDQVRDMCREVGKLHARGQAHDAVQLAASAVELCERTLGRAHYAWPLSLCASAACHVATGDRKAARTQLDDAVACAQALRESDFEHARSVLTHAAELYAEIGDHRIARQLWQDLIQWTGQELGEDHPRYFAARDRLAAEDP